MKQMNDDLITQICIVWVTFISIWISIGSLYDEGIDHDIRRNMENMTTWQSVTPRVGQMFYIKSNRLLICSLDFFYSAILCSIDPSIPLMFSKNNE